jgi:hypothetical protein
VSLESVVGDSRFGLKSLTHLLSELVSGSTPSQLLLDLNVGSLVSHKPSDFGGFVQSVFASLSGTGVDISATIFYEYLPSRLDESLIQDFGRLCLASSLLPDAPRPAFRDELARLERDLTELAYADNRRLGRLLTRLKAASVGQSVDGSLPSPSLELPFSAVLLDPELRLRGGAGPAAPAERLKGKPLSALFEAETVSELSKAFERQTRQAQAEIERTHQGPSPAQYFTEIHYASGARINAECVQQILLAGGELWGYVLYIREIASPRINELVGEHQEFAGEARPGAGLSEEVRDALFRLSSETRGKLEGAGLGQHDIEVVALLSEGHANKEIAHKLNLAEVTVKKRLTRVYRRMGVHSRLELMSAIGRT